MENEDVKKVKKPIFKKWWFWLLAVFVLFIITGMSSNPDNKSENEYTIRFQKTNGEEIVEVKVKKGELVKKPEDPTKESLGDYSYTFSHWATHEKTLDGSEKFDFDKPIKESTTLFAHYEQQYIQRENKVTKENYDKIKNGMTKEQVIEIIGDPTSTSENEIQGVGKTEMFHYQVSTLTGCQVYFSNGKVNMKNWTEL